MSPAQLCFDFGAAAAPVAPISRDFVTARDYWKVGMVTSLPLFCEVQHVGHRYTQMLPGVIETIDDDLASVRIYAAPEYGYLLDDYPLHRHLAIKVPLTELARYHWHTDLQRLADEGRLATGDAELAAAVRARSIDLNEHPQGATQ